MTLTWKRAFAAVALGATSLMAMAELPDGATWLRHTTDDLLPYWRQPAALGSPPGRFPTFRCIGGAAYDAARPCPELAHPPAWMAPELGREYVRMQARQVFAYAMGFHLTGDPVLLAHAAAGVADIRQRALDPATGSAATFHDRDGKPQPPVGERTAQDLAYAGLALAAYYDITRDAATLEDLDRLHRHLMTHFDTARGEMRWALKGPEAGRRELVAQLDPLNAYMVLVTPLLDGERKLRWQADMARLVVAIRRHYCAGDLPRCAGTLDAGGSAAGARHNDYGHSGKAFWMVLLAARQLDDRAAISWATDKGRRVLEEAYVPDTGSWASAWRARGQDTGKSWWIYAELDQLASTLALGDRDFSAFLENTGPFWLKHFVDREHGGEVFGGVSPAGEPGGGLKQHHWKNGYHSIEHALIGYLTAQALAGQPATLYYALKPDTRAKLTPYLYPGREVRREAVGPGVLKVVFEIPAKR